MYFKDDLPTKLKVLLSNISQHTNLDNIWQFVAFPYI